FFNDTATTDIYTVGNTLSLHDALPISVTPLPSGSHPEHRGLSFWMDRVINELENVRSSPDPDAIHDLRVAIRRCRSVAAAMEEVDPDPAWPAMRKLQRKLFRGLGALRD